MKVKLDEKKVNLFENYDILDTIIQKLNIDDIQNILLLNKNVYNYKTYNRYNLIIIRKIMNYFECIRKCDICFTDYSNTNVLLFLRIYNNFKNRTINLFDVLYYLLSKEQKSIELFDILLSYCYYNKVKNNVNIDNIDSDFNALSYYDVLSLMDKRSIDSMIKHIYIEDSILKIYMSIYMNNEEDVLKLFSYLMYKNMYKNNDSKDIIVEIIYEMIYFDKYDLIKKLMKICNQDINYQYIINYIINDINIDENTNIKYINLFNEIIKKQTNKIMITKKHITILMKHKRYKLLDKIITEFINEYINLNGYFNIIKYMWPTNEIHNEIHIKESELLLKHFSDENKKMLMNTNKC